MSFNLTKTADFREKLQKALQKAKNSAGKALDNATTGEYVLDALGAAGGAGLGYLLSRVVHDKPSTRQRLLYSLLGAGAGAAGTHYSLGVTQSSIPGLTIRERLRLGASPVGKDILKAYSTYRKKLKKEQEGKEPSAIPGPRHFLEAIGTAWNHPVGTGLWMAGGGYMGNRRWGEYFKNREMYRASKQDTDALWGIAGSKNKADLSRARGFVQLTEQAIVDSGKANTEQVNAASTLAKARQAETAATDLWNKARADLQKATQGTQKVQQRLDELRKANLDTTKAEALLKKVEQVRQNAETKVNSTYTDKAKATNAVRDAQSALTAADNNSRAAKAILDNLKSKSGYNNNRQAYDRVADAIRDGKIIQDNGTLMRTEDTGRAAIKGRTKATAAGAGLALGLQLLGTAALEAWGDKTNFDTNRNERLVQP